MQKTMIDFDREFNQVQYKLCNNFITLILKAPWTLSSNDTIFWPLS